MKILKISLFCGAIYFFLVSITHLIGLKIPGLFIYYNVPSYSYQDRIISLLALGWAIFFFLAAKDPHKQIIKSILIIGAVAIAMLSFINFITDFASFSKMINPVYFHFQTGLLFIYWFWLVFWYNKLKKNL